MNFIELLKQNGLSDESITKISADMKSNKIYLASEENLDVRYNKLKLEAETNAQELAKSQALITELQKGNKGNEELQAKIKNYELENKKLKEDFEKQKINSALERALMEANVSDIDYIKFKIQEKGEELKLDENEKIVNIKDKLDALKTQFPNQFKASETKITEIKLPNPNDGGKSLTKDEILKKSYQERVKLFNENPDAYNEAMNNNNN